MRPTPARLFLTAAAIAATTLCAGSSNATPQDDEVAQLNAAGHALKSNVLRPGKSARYGHAVSMINAPFSAVHQAVTAYGEYKNLAPDKFSHVRVIAKDGPNTDVYMQIPIMHGMITLSQVVRFGAPQTIAPGVEVVEGRFVSGNHVKDADVVFTLRRLDDNFTVLTCDLSIVPDVPAPQAAIDEELRDSALKAVDALHTRAQGGNNRTLAYLASK